MPRRFAVVLLLSIAAAGAAFAKHDGTLAKGQRGETVRLIQEWLGKAGFPPGRADGWYGGNTEAAVRAFQRAAGLQVDGVAGQATWSALGQAALYGRVKPIASRDLSAPLLSWDLINRIWPRGSSAWIMDLEQRTQIRVVRNGGYWHADIEPATAEDTEILRKWYGRWSWARRPVILRFDRVQCAASINGMPHGADTLKNGFPGHFCLHLLGSRVHHNGTIDAEHQRMVMRAARYLHETAAAHTETEAVDAEPDDAAADAAELAAGEPDAQSGSGY